MKNVCLLVLSAWLLCQPLQSLRASDDPFADLARPQKLSETGEINESNGSAVSFLKNEIDSRVEFAGNSETHFHQALGLEYLVRFSDRTATRSSLNAQLQLVYDSRDDSKLFGNHSSKYLKFDIHNFYFDVFQAFDSFMGLSARKKNIGRFNLRLGRYYLPHGINLQTDTHATLLQLSNKYHFGYERDWYLGLYGSMNDDLKYDLYWMLGSGHDAVYKRQKGLVGLRVSLAGKFLYEEGIESGISFLTGERLAHDSMMGKKHRQTSRIAFDFRKTRALRAGTAKTTIELSRGKDDAQDVTGILTQFELLDSARTNAYAMQIRYFDRHGGMNMAKASPHSFNNGTEAFVDLEFTRYLVNDVNGNRLKWVKLLLSKPLDSSISNLNPSLTLQFYSYW